MQSKIPKPMDIEKAHPLTFARIGDGTVNSLGTALAQELIRFNNLLKVVSSSLVELTRGIKGLVVMSSALEKMFNSFLIQKVWWQWRFLVLTCLKVPENWAAASYPSLKPLGSWVADLIRRVKFIEDWLVNGPPPVYWISGFFFPQGFFLIVCLIFDVPCRVLNRSTANACSQHKDCNWYIDIPNRCSNNGWVSNNKSTKSRSLYPSESIFAVHVLLLMMNLDMWRYSWVVLGRCIVGSREWCSCRSTSWWIVRKDASYSVWKNLNRSLYW